LTSSPAILAASEGAIQYAGLAFIVSMAQLMGKKRPGHLPGFVVRMVIGSDFYSVISMNCQVTNEKARRILDWQPQYPSFREGLIAVINEIRKEAGN
jgi:nucleoside-diphosphate-sugar epimerase